MIRITIAHVGTALAVDAAASIELHASAPCRLVQYDLRRLTIVATGKSTAVLLAGHRISTCSHAIVRVA